MNRADYIVISIMLMLVLFIVMASCVTVLPPCPKGTTDTSLNVPGIFHARTCRNQKGSETDDDGSETDDFNELLPNDQ